MNDECKFCKENNENKTPIKLMPDFEATGLWCAVCGVLLHGEETLLPRELIERIQEWNDLWCSSADNNYHVHINEAFNLKGLQLAREIRKYHPCLLFVSDES